MPGELESLCRREVLDAEVLGVAQAEANPVVTLAPAPMATPQAAPVATPEPFLPVSGFRQGVRDVGRGIGWVTKPWWWPVTEVARDTRRIVGHLRTPGLHLRGWATKAHNDVAAWEHWTPEQRASVVRQQAVWAVALVALSLVYLVTAALGQGFFGFAPLALLSVAWWARSHDAHFPRWAQHLNPLWTPGSPVPHWDVVRWVLGLPQLTDEPR